MQMGTVLFALFDVVVLYCMVVGTYGVEYTLYTVYTTVSAGCAMLAPMYSSV
jgi:hypothetical protein